MAQINKPNEYFNTVLYTGNGTSQSITGVGFQPDFIWVKERSSTSSHQLVDAVRGVYKRLITNSTSAEVDDSSSPNDFNSFDSDGFSILSGGAVNENTQTYASWNWLANGAGTSNTSGSITSTVSASTTSGFSIVSYTGTGSLATVGHGLGIAPSFIFGINRTSGGNWFGYHKSLSATQNIQLNQTSASSTNSTFYNNTEPTSSVFTINTNSDINTSSNNFIAYCFAEKKGFSKAFTYTGNGSTDGSFCYLGFKPAFIMIKSSSDITNWYIFDTARNTYNVSNKILYPDLSNAEYSGGGNEIDILSNGFKARSTNGDTNGSGRTYVGIAFAENPIVGSNNVPSCAR